LDDWYFELWAFNGYNLHVDNNDAKSVGVQVTHSFGDQTSITYTNLYGRESADDAPLEQVRFYQNIYLNQNWGDSWFLTVGFDYGMQTNSVLDNPEETATMYAGLVTLRHQFNPKWSLTTRGEVLIDKNGFTTGTVLDSSGDMTGFELYGLSLGGEYRPTPNSYLRAEGRYTQAADELEIFIENGSTTNQRWEFLVTMGLDLEKAFSF
jgi:hypothetical protein